MKIAALESFIVHLLIKLGKETELVAVADWPTELSKIQSPPVVVEPEESKNPDLMVGIARQPINVKLLAEQQPDIIFTSVPGREKDFISVTSEWTKSIMLPEHSLVVSYNPQSLEQIYQVMQDLGERTKVLMQAREYYQRIKAQLHNWADNFSERCRRKKVIFIKQLQPLTIAGEWLADMINLTGAQSFVPPGVAAKVVDWQDIRNFRPDVIMVAPIGANQSESFAAFKQLESVPGWEDLPAVKRGEVFFSAGDELFYEPGVNMIASMGFIVSAIAGFESGYITTRDSFQRLRWLEMQRHRF